MERKELLENIAPCSLMCYTCGGYEKGAICKLAGELSGYLEGIYDFMRSIPARGKKRIWNGFKYFRKSLQGWVKRDVGAAGTVNITDAVSAAVSFWNV